jgi:hypothetical protein
VLLLGVADVGVDEQAVDLAVDVLDGDLEAVEAPRLRPLDLGREVLREVLVDDAVRRREEREDVRDEVRSLSLSLTSQSLWSCARSTSSAVQNDASAFLYMAQTSLCSMGNSTKRFGFSSRSGSGAKFENEPASSCFLRSVASLGAKHLAGEVAVGTRAERVGEEGGLMACFGLIAAASICFARFVASVSAAMAARVLGGLGCGWCS